MSSAILNYAILPTDDWADIACLTAAKWGAYIVGEGNYGGKMIEALIRKAWRKLRTAGRIPWPIGFVPVTARLSKPERAEPAAKAHRDGDLLYLRPEVIAGTSVQWLLGRDDNGAPIYSSTDFSVVDPGCDFEALMTQLKTWVFGVTVGSPDLWDALAHACNALRPPEGQAVPARIGRMGKAGFLA